MTELTDLITRTLGNGSSVHKLKEILNQSLQNKEWLNAGPNAFITAKVHADVFELDEALGEQRYIQVLKGILTPSIAVIGSWSEEEINTIREIFLQGKRGMYRKIYYAVRKMNCGDARRIKIGASEYSVAILRYEQESPMDMTTALAMFVK